MNVGLPGTGIGGMFYLLSALCMPAVEAFRGLRRGRVSAWPMVRRQALLALGIILGIWFTGWVLAEFLAGVPLIAAALRGAGINGRSAPNILRTATLVMSLGTLGLIIVSVWVAKLVVHGMPGGNTRAFPRRMPRGLHRRKDRTFQEYDAA